MVDFNRNPELLSMESRIQASYESMYYGTSSNDPHVDAAIRNRVQDDFEARDLVIEDNSSDAYLNGTYKQAYGNVLSDLIPEDSPDRENMGVRRNVVEIQYDEFVDKNEDFGSVMNDRYIDRYKESPDMLAKHTRDFGKYEHKDERFHMEIDGEKLETQGPKSSMVDRIEASYAGLYFGEEGKDPDVDKVIQNEVQHAFVDNDVVLSDDDHYNPTEVANDTLRQAMRHSLIELTPEWSSDYEHINNDIERVEDNFDTFSELHEDFPEQFSDAYKSRYGHSVDLMSSSERDDTFIPSTEILNNKSDFERELASMSAIDRDDFEQEMHNQNADEQAWVNDNLDEYNQGQEEQARRDGVDIGGNKHSISDHFLTVNNEPIKNSDYNQEVQSGVYGDTDGDKHFGDIDGDKSISLLEQLKMEDVARKSIDLPKQDYSHLKEFGSDTFSKVNASNNETVVEDEPIKKVSMSYATHSPEAKAETLKQGSRAFEQKQKRAHDALKGDGFDRTYEESAGVLENNESNFTAGDSYGYDETEIYVNKEPEVEEDLEDDGPEL